MNSGERFNQFAQQHGASILHQEESLILQKELGEEIAFWGSVYGSEFVEMPENALTSENEYRKWCWKHTGMMPEKRTPKEFDKYIRPRMIEATIRPILAGSEYGIEIEDAIEAIFELHQHEKAVPDLDEEGAGRWSRGLMFWFETLPDSVNGAELIIKIKPLMRLLNTRESVGLTQGKIRRKDVLKRLAYYGRQVDDRNGGVERRLTVALRSTPRHGLLVSNSCFVAQVKMADADLST
jgi:hypothetical protein